MLKIIREILLKIVNDIDTGNSNLSPEECEEVIEYLSGITNKNEKLSKYQACKYLKVSRATFDNYVKAKKIPNGRKQIGFKVETKCLQEWKNIWHKTDGILIKSYVIELYLKCAKEELMESLKR